MWIDQSLHGVEIRNVKGKYIREVDKYIKDNFINATWLAFDHKWFIPDKDNGRSEIINKMKKLTDNFN